MQAEIVIIVEHLQGRVLPRSFELAAFAREIQSIEGGRITAVVLGQPVRNLAREMAEKTGVEVIGLEHETLTFYNAEAYNNALKKWSEENHPRYVLLPHSATGWDIAPVLSVSLNASYVPAALSLHRGKRGIVLTRPVLEGRVHTRIELLPDKPAVITLSPGIFSTGEDEQPPEPGKVTVLPVDLPEPRSRTIGYQDAPKRKLDLTKAPVIVAAGRGVGSKENLYLLEELVSLFEGGNLAASRPLCDAGWLSLEHQVGLTGQTVSPRLYIACGISGAIQHTAGMKGSHFIVAINSNPQALIFQTAHCCIARDLHEFLPVLVERIKKLKGIDSN